MELIFFQADTYTWAALNNLIINCFSSINLLETVKKNQPTLPVDKLIFILFMNIVYLIFLIKIKLLSNEFEKKKIIFKKIRIRSRI